MSAEPPRSNDGKHEGGFISDTMNLFTPEWLRAFNNCTLPEDIDQEGFEKLPLYPPPDGSKAQVKYYRGFDPPGSIVLVGEHVVAVFEGPDGYILPECLDQPTCLRLGPTRRPCVVYQRAKYEEELAQIDLETLKQAQEKNDTPLSLLLPIPGAEHRLCAQVPHRFISKLFVHMKLEEFSWTTPDYVIVLPKAITAVVNGDWSKWVFLGQATTTEH